MKKSLLGFRTWKMFLDLLQLQDVTKLIDKPDVRQALMRETIQIAANRSTDMRCISPIWSFPFSILERLLRCASLCDELEVLIRIEEEKWKRCDNSLAMRYMSWSKISIWWQRRDAYWGPVFCVQGGMDAGRQCLTINIEMLRSQYCFRSGSFDAGFGNILQWLSVSMAYKINDHIRIHR